MLINSTNTNAAPALTLPLPNLQCGADGTAGPTASAAIRVREQ